MQQGHPRHKQLSRARHEMAMHRRYVFASKMSTAINGINEIGRAFVRGLRNIFVAKPRKQELTDPDIYREIHRPEGSMQIIPPKFNEYFTNQH